MPDTVMHALETLARVLEIIGASALILGFVICTGKALLEVRSLGPLTAYHRYRVSLGRVVLLGLEVLVAATIIKTITVDPTLASLGLLAAMVAIRTILGWTTVLEMSGRWPWQRAPKTESQSTA